MTQLGVFRDSYYNAANVLTSVQYNARTDATGATLPASVIAGAELSVLAESGNATAVTYTTDTAANIIARLQTAVYTQLAAQGGAAGFIGDFPAGVPNLTNLTWEFTINNNNTAAGAVTIVGGAGVTINTQSPAAIAIGTARDYQVTVTGPNTVTLQQITQT